MQPDFSSSPSIESIQVNNGVVTLAGYGLDIRIDRGRLNVKDGIASHRREGRFTKATCGIKRFVILGHTGTITLEAMRWLNDIGAGVIQIDADSKVILASVPRTLDNVFLRRSQALAYSNKTGTTIVKGLLTQKLRGQADVAKQLGGQAEVNEILSGISALDDVKDISSIRVLEGQAANIYWNLWANVQMNFVRIDASAVPEHWRRFVQRGSPLTNSQRNAANPINALLNYLYAILEAEARIAILTVGLDPGMGFLHQDLQNRDSLIYDIMEAVRPAVDRWLLDFLRKTRFVRKDFFERRDGTVRITSQVARLLAPTAPLWKRQVAPHVEWVAKQLLRPGITKQRENLPTPLTQRNRSQGRERLGNKRRKIIRNVQITHRQCKECGKRIEQGRGQFCSQECLDTYKEKLLLPNFEKAGITKLKELRQRGKDPAHGGEAAKRRGQSNADRARARTDWEAIHGDGDEERKRFVSEIQPKLKNVPLSAIVQTTGFSKRYASLIKRGLYVPHPVHYGKLLMITNTP